MTEQNSTTMRDLFPGYYRPNEEEFAELWKNCFVVLDTNVLLNLYRYDQKTRDEFLKVLGILKDRLWIPHQVALEFQENRLNTIRGQNQKLDNLRKALDDIKSKLRDELIKYPSIPHQDLLEETSTRFKAFLDNLQSLENQQLNVNDSDYVREQIDQLFNHKIGASPSQTDLEDIYKEGKERYANKYPPGYKDDTPDKKKEPHLCNGLVFKREYGDLIVWKEILKQVKNENWKYLIFITDDDKEDWWLIEKGETLGSRPELIEEIFKSGVTSFYMYSSERFLKFASQYIPDVNIKEESIRQVEDVIELAREEESPKINEKEIVSLVADWIQSEHINDRIIFSDRTIDLIRLSQSSSLPHIQSVIGYEVKYLRQGVRMSNTGMKIFLRQLATYIHQHNLDKAYLVAVINNQSSSKVTLLCCNYQKEVNRLNLNEKIGLIIGTVLNYGDENSSDYYFAEVARIEPHSS